MQRFYNGVVKHHKLVLTVFIAVSLLCLILQNAVGVNYDMNDYLPKDVASTVALSTMEDEFSGGIPNARVMVKNVTIPQALEYKTKLEGVNGVTEVTWLDDAVDITTSLSMIDEEVLESYYKDNVALFTVTIEKEYRIEAVDAIRELIGDENSMTGSAVSTAIATTNTVS